MKGGEGLRDTLFPIYGSQELLKFASVASIKFFIGKRIAPDVGCEVHEAAALKRRPPHP